MTKKQQKELEIEDAKKFLREILNANGRRVWTSVKSVSRSGMMRQMRVYTVRKSSVDTDWVIMNITYWVALATERSFNSDKGTLRVGGCGMDMGFAVGYAIGRRLWPNGDGVTKSNRNGDTGLETDGGYLIHQEWL